MTYISSTLAVPWYLATRGVQIASISFSRVFDFRGKKGFFSWVLLQRHSPEAKLLRVYDFTGVINSGGQNFHPAKYSRTLNRLDIWEQVPGAY